MSSARLFSSFRNLQLSLYSACRMQNKQLRDYQVFIFIGENISFERNQLLGCYLNTEWFTDEC